MIVSNLKDCKQIESLHPLFKKLFDYINTHDLLHAPLGRIEIEGSDLFINNDEITGKTRRDAKFEYHRKYIDVHVILSGVETIGWKPLCEMKSTGEYNDAKDYAFTDDKPSAYVALHKGQFMVVFPNDLHAPTIGRGKIRKLVAKVRV